MKISIVTACRNSAATIRDAMESVCTQRLEESDRTELEYLVIDGGSTDGTVACIRDFESQLAAKASAPFLSFRWISEPDCGMYDALNKGIRMATGDVIGICNADDILSGDRIVAQIASRFETESKPDCVYGDVRFVKGGSSLDQLRAAKTTRYCTGRFFRRWMFRFATFPAHPSTFVRRDVFEKAGLYSLDYRICADFEFMLRIFWKHRVRAKYMPLCTHIMRTGGLSTNGWRSNVEINREDLRALKANGYWSCLPLIYLKYPFKIFGLLHPHWPSMRQAIRRRFIR